jgi:hypothetical protein
VSVGLKFVKKVDENWRDRITYIDGTPYNEDDIVNEGDIINEDDIVEEKFDSIKTNINKIEKFIDDLKY